MQNAKNEIMNKHDHELTTIEQSHFTRCHTIEKLILNSLGFMFLI